MTPQNPATSIGPAMTSATAGLNLSDSVYERLLR
ncbi:MAG: ATP-dependent Clp protease proteolytic subunit, partial [Rhodococcus ruber]|nr:ATP-dependent Clp protease proteolytic subunit [Rhodococcus ruber]